MAKVTNRLTPEQSVLSAAGLAGRASSAAAKALLRDVAEAVREYHTFEKLRIKPSDIKHALRPAARRRIVQHVHALAGELQKLPWQVAEDIGAIEVVAALNVMVPLFAKRPVRKRPPLLDATMDAAKTAGSSRGTPAMTIRNDILLPRLLSIFETRAHKAQRSITPQWFVRTVCAAHDIPVPPDRLMHTKRKK